MFYQQPYYVPQQYQQAPLPKEEFKGGFHPFYIWPIISICLTYGYIILFFIASNFLRDSYKDTGLSVSQFAFLFFPLVITIANTAIAVICYRKTDRRFFLGASIIIKYGLIPYFIAGGLLIAIFFLLIFTPVVIMIFVSPPIIIVLSIIGWISLSESAPFMIVYFIKAGREGVFKGRNGGKAGSIAFPIIGSVMQMFFCLDVIAAVFACFKEKRHVKLTITVLAAPPVIFGILMALLIGTSAVR
jgi:hypothetical protein